MTTFLSTVWLQSYLDYTLLTYVVLPVTLSFILIGTYLLAFEEGDSMAVRNEAASGGAGAMMERASATDQDEADTGAGLLGGEEGDGGVW